MSFYNLNLTAEELNSLPKYLHPAHMFAIAKLLSVLRRAFEDQDPELHRKGLLSATVSQHLIIKNFKAHYRFKALVLPLIGSTSLRS